MSPMQQMLLGVGKSIDKRYIDDVFSTFLYKGTDGANTVNNGINLSESGGLVWVKSRTSSRNSMLFDTVRGANYEIATQSTSASNNNSGLNQTFTSTGFTFNNSHSDVNSSGDDYTSYTFRKAPGFFDVVSWTGDNDTNRAISHSLGSTPGMIWVKNTSNSFDWAVWHRSIWDTSGYKSVQLNTNAAQNGWNAFWGVSAPTSSNFYVRSNGANVSGQTYIAYVFAHDDQSFGGAADASLIKCGSYTGNGSSGVYGTQVTLGWEPQWVLIKHSSGTSDWKLFDSMRGVVQFGADRGTQPNKSDADFTSSDRIDFNPTGFYIPTASGAYNGNGSEYIYCAIRRPDGYVGKPPSVGTDVFSLVSGRNSPEPTLLTNFVTDFGIFKYPTAVEGWFWSARLMQGKYLYTNSNDEEASTTSRDFDYNDGWSSGGLSGYQGWSWKRSAGMDVVTYKGDGSNRQIAHSLGKSAEMVWIKNRSDDKNMLVGSSALTNWGHYLHLTNTDGESSASSRFNSTAPTATHFTVGTNSECNKDDDNYVALLFSSVSNISSVGSYSGNGQTGSSGTFVSTGFQPRFLILKRFSGHGQDWLVYDSLRGFGTVGGNAPTLYLNENYASANSATQVEVSSTGFRLVSDNIFSNGSGSDYLYYAHA